MAESQAGNHVGLYEIKDKINELVDQLSDAGISIDSLFCDLDAGF